MCSRKCAMPSRSGGSSIAPIGITSAADDLLNLGSETSRTRSPLSRTKRRKTALSVGALIRGGGSGTGDEAGAAANAVSEQQARMKTKIFFTRGAKERVGRTVAGWRDVAKPFAVNGGLEVEQLVPKLLVCM